MTNEEYRREYLRLLRETPEERHIRGEYSRRVNGRMYYCAVGLSRLMVNTNESSLPNVLRLSKRTRRDIIDWNDEDKLTFTQIANKVEGLYEEYPLP